jgi:hypothetical protein
MSRRACAAGLAVALLIVLTLPVMAQTTSRQMINLEGRAYDQASPPNPLAGSNDMVFGLFGADIGGTALFAENHPAVTFNNGYYAVKLGELTTGGIPSSVFANNDLYLEIQIGTETLSPRVRLTSEAFAFNADMLDGSHASAFAPSTGSANYLQNQTGSAQTAGFNISGNGLIGTRLGVGNANPVQRLQLGTHAYVSTSTPECIDLGGTYSNTAGTNVKLRLYDDGTYVYGFGVSLNQFDYVAPLGSNKHVFYAAGTALMAIQGNGNVGIATTSPTAALDINAATGYNQLRLRASFTPSGTSDSSGNVGDISWDSDYMYVKTSSGWKRAALSTW